jgi:AcrR family transcriptional regulator
MIDAIGEKGYLATTIADLTRRAGVSRNTFYQHFANKQQCLLLAHDAVQREGLRRIERSFREAEGWPGRVEAAIQTLFEAAIESPGALRLALVEVSAGGPEGIARREQALAQYERFIREALKLAPGDGEVSEAATKAIVGGLSRVLARRIASDENGKLLALVPDLVQWAIAYYPAPPTITSQVWDDSTSTSAPASLEGGRAPGSLAPLASLIARRGLRRGDQNVSRSFVVHSQRERILDAVANLTAANGYASLKVEDIAETAAVSLQAFYEHFIDKEDAFLVAYEVGHAKGQAIVERAFLAAPDWQHGVKAGIAALLAFLGSEPSFAHLGLIDTSTATPRAAERSNAGMTAYAQMLVPGMEQAGSQAPPTIAIEAIAGGLFELFLHHALQGRTHELPKLTVPATYIALAPFIGGEEAARVATRQDG